MHVLRAALGRDVDLAHIVAVLGGKDAAFDLELLQRVQRRQEQEAVEIGVGVLDAVEGVVVEVDALPGDAQRKFGSRTSLPRVAHARRRAVGGDAGSKGGKLEVVAAVQRQFQNAPVFDDGADGGIIGLNHLRAARDLDHLGDVADLENDIHAGHLRHLEVNVRADLCIEALHLDLQRVPAWRQRRHVVEAGLVRVYDALKIRGRVVEGDLRAGDGGAAAVGNGSRDLSRRRLGHNRRDQYECGRGTQEKLADYLGTHVPFLRECKVADANTGADPQSAVPKPGRQWPSARDPSGWNSR